MSIVLRIATESDLPAITTIYDQAVAEQATADLVPPSAEDQRHWFLGHDPSRYPILVAELDEGVAAWLSFSPHRPGRGAVAGAVELSYYVHEDHRRRGLASRLLKEALKRCPNLGFHTAFTILLADNLPSIELLQRFGFVEWGRLPEAARFGERRVDHLYLGRRLD
jgi:L-amino acid N-acyltransferase YncA